MGGASDNSTGPPTIIVNETFAKTLFPDGSALERHIRSRWDENVAREIVGVVADVGYRGVTNMGEPAVFVPHTQSPRHTMGFLLRTEGDPAMVLPAVRNVMGTVDADVALARVATLDELLHCNLARFRFMTALLSVFGGIALALATVGVYGLVSFTVAQRTHELGIRMALGARAASVRTLVLRQAAGIAAVGMLIGLAGALALTRVLGRMLFGVSALDPVAFIGPAVVLFAATVAASYVPARWATKVDPAEALRVN